MDLSELADLGWDSFFQQQLTDEQSAAVVPVRVMNVHKSGLQIAGIDVDTQVEPITDDEDGRATVGDWLLLNVETNRIVRRLDRKSLFKRRAPGTDRREQLIAANVDTLFIVSSCNQDFNEARLERYLAIAREAEVMALIVLTKSDLADEPQEFVRRAAKLAPGVHVEAVNALDTEALRCLEAWLGHGQTVALLGSSGVGKSTISNTLLGGSDITTQSIRDDDAKGRHTTTSRTMHHLPGGAWLLDTPGMRELQLTDVRTGLDDVFAEITALAAACKFVDCTHEAEPGCAVRQAIDDDTIDEDRLNRWRKLVKEEAYNKESIADRRARGRALGKFYKSVIEDKKSRKN
ncbi:MAG: ribosome small subunit-dependent GTPase A [Gammaproteobacteria bacterium]|nr:MAG: ribosome small subunit-dependent GTPase A [Gammaproteobacteria bacterium]